MRCRSDDTVSILSRVSMCLEMMTCLFPNDFEGMLVVGRRESEPSNNFKGRAIKKGS